MSNLYLIGIESEQERVTKKIYKKLMKIEDGNEEDEDSDDSQSISQSDKEILEKFGEDDKEEDLVEGKYLI